MILRRAAQALRGWARNPRLPVRTVRTRLTLLYGALFLVSGAALLAIAYTLTWNATRPPGTTRGHIIRHAGHRRPAHALRAPKTDLLASQHATVMHQLLISCAIALAITAVLSVALGWLVAGRVLRPLRTMTAATQRISDHNLHERLAVGGPADELKQLGDTIDDLLARLEAAFDAQRRFVANASHELRTPLTMMRTALDVATRKPGPPAPGVTALAGKIRAGLDKADRLVESFLILARAQHGGTIRTSTVALDQLAATVLAEHSAAVSDLRLTVEQDHHHAPVPGNQPLLTHLIGNLIGNAIRHNQPGGWIRIATSTGTGTAELVVENTGPVLDPGRAGELLQPFRRAAPDRTGAGGTGAGLGLSIVAAIVATHHGTLDLHARPGGGL
ncbi:MAG: HAMP domain-containing protein, partial [Actinobacteria bacterium]|nr:HAMP domain-containing protein [Actinomycetota bacterium]